MNDIHSKTMMRGAPVLTFLATISIALGQFLGPANVKLLRMEKCDKDHPDVNVTISLNKLNRTHVGINVYIDTAYDFDDNVSLNLTVAKWGDGGWKPHALDVYDKSGCDFFMKYADDKFAYLLQTQGRPGKCPVTKGIFDVKDYIYDGVLKVPMTYGDFRGDMTLWLNHEFLLTCVRVYVTISPAKPSG